MNDLIPEQTVPDIDEENQVVSSAGDRFSAAWEAESIRTDAWGVWQDGRKELIKEVGETVFDDPDAFEKFNNNRGRGIRSQTNDIDQWLKSIQADPNLDPKIKGVSPVDQSRFEGELNRRMTERYEETQKVLRQAPNDAFAVETAGGLLRAATDEVGIATGVLGAFTGGTSIGLRGLAIASGREAALGAGGEALTLGRQYEAAERLGVEDPNALSQVAAAAGISAGFVVAGRAGSSVYQAGRDFITADRLAAKQSQDNIGSPLSVDRDVSREQSAEAAVTEGDWSRLPEDDRTQEEIAAGSAPPRATTNIIPQAGSIADEVRSGLVERGMPQHIADAFLLNFWDESRLNPGINEASPIVAGSRGGFGLSQWTGPRRRELEAYAAERGTDVSDLDTQLDFLMIELRGSEKAAGDAIFAATDTPTAAVEILERFLRPAASHRARRRAKYLGGEAPDYSSATPSTPRRSILPSDDGPATGQFVSVRPSEVGVDPNAYQFKGGINEIGEDGTLRDITEWNDRYAGEMVFHERNDGSLWVADGHQRHGAATRLEASGSDPIFLRGHVLREADGWTADMAMVEAAAKNIASGSGDALDQARILRSFPEYANTLQGNARARDAIGLSRLGDEAWGLAINGKISPSYAGIIGEATRDAAEQTAIARSFIRNKPANLDEARFMARDAVQFGMVRGNNSQASLFGDDFDGLDTLLTDRAKVANGAERYLRKNRSIFQTLTRNADRAESGGNILNRSGNAAAADEAGELIDIIRSLANRSGSVSDALNRAAAIRRESGDEAGIDLFVEFLRGAEINDLVQGERVARAGGDNGSPDQPFASIAEQPEPPELDFSSNIPARIQAADAGFDRARELVGQRQTEIIPSDSRPDDLLSYRQADDDFLNEEFEIDGQVFTARSAISEMDEDLNFLDQLNQCRG